MMQEVRLPEISENVESGEVVKVLVAAGDPVTVDQPLAELETEKAVFEVPSPFSGRIAAIGIEPGDTIKVGEVIASVETAPGRPPDEDETKGPEVAKSPAQLVSSEPVREPTPVVERAQPAAAAVRPTTVPLVAASPSVRRLARELGVDIGEVTGSGPAGRISRDDVKNHAKDLVSAKGTPPPGSAGADSWGPVRTERMSRVRMTTARNMAQAWTVPHVTHADLCDITELEDARKRYGPRVEAAGGKLTITAILLKIVGSALKVFPRFNATVDVEREEVILKSYVNIGVAVDTDRGLLVPVIRNVDDKSITEISVELSAVAQKARKAKLAVEDMEGGSFTVSNLGGIGGTGFTPIIYPKQTAILGVVRAKTEAVYREDRFIPRLMLPLVVSYDHRIIDGADGARFLRWICEALENPFVVLLGGNP